MTYDCQVMKPPVGCKHLPVKLACNKIISSKYIQNEIVFFFLFNYKISIKRYLSSHKSAAVFGKYYFRSIIIKSIHLHN